MPNNSFRRLPVGQIPRELAFEGPRGGSKLEQQERFGHIRQALEFFRGEQANMPPVASRRMRLSRAGVPLVLSSLGPSDIKLLKKFLDLPPESWSNVEELIALLRRPLPDRASPEPAEEHRIIRPNNGLFSGYHKMLTDPIIEEFFSRFMAGLLSQPITFISSRYDDLKQERASILGINVTFKDFCPSRESCNFFEGWFDLVSYLVGQKINNIEKTHRYKKSSYIEFVRALFSDIRFFAYTLTYIQALDTILSDRGFLDKDYTYLSNKIIEYFKVAGIDMPVGRRAQRAFFRNFLYRLTVERLQGERFHKHTRRSVKINDK